MAKMTSVTLDDHATRFLTDQVAAGHFASASEAVAAAISLLEARDTARAELRAEIDAGDASGAAEDFDIRAFIARKRAGLAA